MGLFGKIFEKKVCGVCGNEIGLLGNNKLEDANMCNACAGKLSPYFVGRRHATLAQIKEQLAYREENKRAVQKFNPTRTLGVDTKVYIDEDDGKVAVCNKVNWREANPDIFDFSQVTGCDYEVEENRKEIRTTNADGRSVSYDPPRYDYDYDFYVTILVNHPYVGKIRFKVNRMTIERPHSAEYLSAENTCKDIRDALAGVREGVRQSKAPKTAMQCPHCMATTIPDANGRCEYCGGSLY